MFSFKTLICSLLLKPTDHSRFRDLWLYNINMVSVCHVLYVEFVFKLFDEYIDSQCGFETQSVYIGYVNI